MKKISLLLLFGSAFHFFIANPLTADPSSPLPKPQAIEKSSLFLPADTVADSLVDETEKIDQSIDTSKEHITPDYQKAFYKMIISLIALLAFLILTFWMFKRLMRSRIRSANSSHSIKILERRTLSPKSILYLIEIDNDRVLIAESHLDVRALHYLEKKETPSLPST